MALEKRPIAPTYAILKQNEACTKDSLRSILLSAHSIESAEIGTDFIRAEIAKIKSAIAEYSSASKQLSSYCTKNGSVAESGRISIDRLELIHSEAKECVQNLNTLITQAGEMAESCVPSQATSTIASSHAEDRTSSKIERRKQEEFDLAAQHNDLPYQQSEPIDRPFEQESQNLGENSSQNLDNNQQTRYQNIATSYENSTELQNTFENLNLENHQNQNYQIPSDSRLDPISRRMLKNDLRNGIADKYNGDPQVFWAWYHEINSRLIECEASPSETLFILKANTTKKPRSIIDDYLSGGLSNPSRLVAEIWDSFKKRFGSNTRVTTHLLGRLKNINKISNVHQIDEMEQVLSLCKVIRVNMEKCPDLKYLETQQGMREIWNKFPDVFVSRWRKEVTSRERRTGNSPSFQDLIDNLSYFIEEFSNPNFVTPSTKIKSYATEVKNAVSTSHKGSKSTCIYHNNRPGHTIEECRVFKDLDYTDKREFAAKNKRCYNCLGDHLANRCDRNACCSICQKRHIDIMHADGNFNFKERNSTENDKYRRVSGSSPQRTSSTDRTSSSQNRNSNSRRNSQQRSNGKSPKSFCATVCNASYGPKTCSKTVPIEMRIDDHGSKRVIRGLCIIDEQANNTFIDENAVKMLKIPSTNIHDNDYHLTTLSNQGFLVQGSVIRGLQVRGIRESTWIDLPPTLTHPNLPDTREETASPTIVRAHSHIAKYASNFPEIDPNLEVIILIGANCGKAMKTRSFGRDYPFVHHTALRPV